MKTMNIIKQNLTKITLSKLLTVLLFSCIFTFTLPTLQATPVNAQQNKNNIVYSLMYCNSSKYNAQLKTYESILLDKNNNTFVIYTDANISHNYYITVINDHANSDIFDDEIINIYNLYDYIFTE